ncbi:DinB family protein [Ideonella sp. A 288]|uniref:DinB family protein n=1 Tax=Ideonella sp. A 288 TaxID=1962181 RepID=UPI000B4A8683|nr:DinB family protein [Ideonella sp. A 288]
MTPSGPNALHAGERKGAPSALPQLYVSSLPASPAAAWGRVCDSAFLGRYLGARLPAQPLAVGARLDGLDPEGRPLSLTILGADPPSSLWLAVHGHGGHSQLHLSLAPSPRGSRLTVLHEADGPARREPAQAEADDDLARLLATPLPPALRAGRVADAAALASAVRHLAGTAELVQALRVAMAPRQGYERPAAGRFSLAEHLWHLADVETFGWVHRFARLRDEVMPVLLGVDGDRLALERRYQQRPWRGAARRFVAERRRTLAVLSSLPIDALARPVVFSGQASNGAEVLAAMLAHDQEHRLEMADLWRALRIEQGQEARP